MAKKKRRSTAKKTATRRPRRKKISTRKRVGVKRKPAKKRRVIRKRRPAKARRVVKQVERRSVERVMAGTRKRRRRSEPRKRRVVMAGRRGRRSVGAVGGTGLLIAGAIGLAALYLITKKPAVSPGGTFTLPPIATTNNYTRNTQANDLVQYAIAGGLAIDAIIKLIDRLNTSNDQEVENIYDRVRTTGDFSTYV